MDTKTDLKKRITLLLGSTVLAVALTAVPVSIHLDDLTVGSGAAFAKGGNSGSGSDSSGRGDGSDDDDNSGSGSSNSGRGGGSDDDDDDDNSGSGSSNSGRSGGSDDDDDDDNSGSGSSNSGRGSDDDDDDNRGDRRSRRGGSDDGRGGSNTAIPDKFGFVVKGEIQGNHIEVGYSDGWKEEVENGRYELKNPSNRTVIERPATRNDINRLNAAIRGSRL